LSDDVQHWTGSDHTAVVKGTVRHLIALLRGPKPYQRAARACWSVTTWFNYRQLYYRTYRRFT